MNRRHPYGIWLLTLLMSTGMMACDRAERVKTGTGEITVITDPVGAQVFLNGQPHGVSPSTIGQLSAGPQLIEVRRAGYRVAHVTVNLFDGQRVAREIALEPLQALLLVESTPPGADVMVGDTYRGQTPLLLHDLPFGSHRIMLQAENYFPREMTVNLEDRTPRHITVELVSDSAVVAIQSTPPGGAIRIDGASHGLTPTRVERVKTGTVLVEISLEGYVPFQQEMRLRAGEEARLDAALIPLPSGLTVYSAPPEARVYVNNQIAGDTPLTLTNLTVGEYEVRVEKRGYAPQQRSVRLGSGARGIEEFRLERNSGTLVLVTEPAGVQVYVDGTLAGVTTSQESDVISEPFTVDLLEEGDHRLQLTLQGYTWRPKPFRIEMNQVLSMHERMTRMFLPNTRIRTGEGAAEAFTGVLIRRHPNGDVDLETHPGIIVTLSADEILSIEPIRRN